MAIDARVLAVASKVTGKRPRAVIDHIIKHGQITTEELKDKYGYNHPPRAARDVRECGIPLETFRVTDSAGRKIAAYRFGDPGKIEKFKLGGRSVFSKAFKNLLLQRQGAKCAITGELFESRYLNIDHRIPFEVAGNRLSTVDHPEGFMLISAPAQRQKSWSCEHCQNFVVTKNAKICQRCFWASPEDYDHIAGEERRRLDIYWIGDEVKQYFRLAAKARRLGIGIREFVRSLVDESLKK